MRCPKCGGAMEPGVARFSHPADHGPIDCRFWYDSDRGKAPWERQEEGTAIEPLRESEAWYCGACRVILPLLYAAEMG